MAFVSLAAFLSLVLLSSAQEKPRCGDFCKFYFCRADGFDTVFERVGPRLLMRDPVVASQPYVCRKIDTDSTPVLNQTIGIAGKTGEALVYPADDRGISPRPTVPISEYNPDGLNKKFPANYFSLEEIKRFPAMPGKYSLQRKMSRGNQEIFVDDLCVALPIPDYNLLKDNGGVKKKVRGSTAMGDCISFRTVVPTVLIEFTWDSADDLDLTVIEPNKNKINFKNSKSDTGGRLIFNDNENAETCGIDTNGREQVRWLQATGEPLNGKYTVILRHAKNCGDGPTKWNLKVVVGGKQILLEKGMTDEDKNAKIATIEFTLDL